MPCDDFDEAARPRVLGPGRYRCAGPEAMRALGRALGACLQAGHVVVLSGDLGAGKTCLTGGAAQGLGDASPVTSPTFQIMCVHDGGRVPLYHFDLYRLDDAAQLEDVGLYDVLGGDGACLVEWGDLFDDELGEGRLDVRITREPVALEGVEPARIVEARGRDEEHRALLERLDAALRQP